MEGITLIFTPGSNVEQILIQFSRGYFQAAHLTYRIPFTSFLVAFKLLRGCLTTGRPTKGGGAASFPLCVQRPPGPLLLGFPGEVVLFLYL
jgi:hypothetical protein